MVDSDGYQTEFLLSQNMPTMYGANGRGDWQGQMFMAPTMYSGLHAHCRVNAGFLGKKEGWSVGPDVQDVRDLSDSTICLSCSENGRMSFTEWLCGHPSALSRAAVLILVVHVVPCARCAQIEPFWTPSHK